MTAEPLPPPDAMSGIQALICTDRIVLRHGFGRALAYIVGMSLPPGFLTNCATRISRQVVGGNASMLGQPQVSNQARGDMWGLPVSIRKKSASSMLETAKGFT